MASHGVLVASDGTERAISDSAAPIRWAGGEVAGVGLVFRDITARRATERSLIEEPTLRGYGASLSTLLESTCPCEVRRPTTPDGAVKVTRDSPRCDELKW